MNPGRGATRLGNDAIPIWVDVPRWLAPKMRHAFHAAGIEHEVREGYIQGSRGPEHCEDRFVFPMAATDDVRGPARARAAAALQRIVNSVPGSRPPRP